MAKTMAEVEQERDKLAEQAVSLQSEITRLKGELQNVDRNKPGMTRDQQAAHKRELESRDVKIAELSAQLLELSTRDEADGRELAALRELQAAQRAMEGEDNLTLIPVAGMVGLTEALPGLGRVPMALFGHDVEGGGLLLVAKVGDALNVQVLPDLKLTKKPHGHVLQLRPHRR